MRNILPLISLLCLFASAPAAAQDDYIGLFTDTGATDCDVAFGGIGQSVTVEVVAVVPGISGVTAVEFSVANLPVNGTGGILQATWNSPLVIGDVYTGISIAFPETQAGPLVHIGTLTFFDISGTWVGDDHLLTVQESAVGRLVVVNDDYAEVPVGGGRFTFNCTDPGGCDCLAEPVTSCLLFPSSLNFGDILVGDTATHSFDIMNTGDTPISGSVAAGCGDFVVTSGSGAYSIQSGETHSVVVDFTPTAPGLQTCDLDLGGNVCGVMSLTGNGLGGTPLCEVSTELLDFGAVILGADSTRVFQVTNNGDADLYLEIPLAPCAPDSSFRMLNAGYHMIGPGGTVGLYVRFAPTTAGFSECLLDLGTECPGILFQGEGIELVEGCEVLPPELDFPDTELGLYADLDLTVTNTGESAQDYHAIIDDPHFHLESGGGAFSLASGEARAITVRFQPQAVGAHVAVLELTNDNCDLVPLSGTALPISPDCALSTTFINFGPVSLGEDAFGYVTVSNEGGSPFTIDVPATPCPDTPAFSILNAGSFPINPGEERILQIRFLPEAAGDYNCEFDLGGNDCPPITLTGYGQDYVEPAGNHIGLYLDEEAQICQTPLDGAGQLVYARILAVLPEFTGIGITAVEFRLDNLPDNLGPPNGMWTVQWNSGLVIGNVEDGVALAWAEPQPGPIVELGLMTFISNDQTDWIGVNHTVTAAPSNSGGLSIVDENYNTLPVGGGSFTFNCEIPGGCDCYAPAEPICQVTPSALDFGIVAVGASAIETFTISNLGDGILTGFVQENCDEFEIVTGAGYFALANGDSRNVMVRFQPVFAGPRSCEVDLGSSHCENVLCEGIGWVPEPVCALEPDSLLQFDDIPTGTTQVKDFVIQNIGAGIMDGFVSAACTHFSVVAGGGPFSLSTMQSRTVSVEFHPDLPGAYECVIDLANAWCSEMPVAGAAHEPMPGCALVPDSLDFGDQPLGGYWELGAEIVNTGDMPLAGDVTLDSPHFSVTEGGGPFTLPVGESLSVLVRYTPLDLGTHTAVLATGLAYCAELPLSGMAHEPAPTCDIDPTALAFGDVTLGVSVSASFTVQNQGDGPLSGEVVLDDEHFSLLQGAGVFELQPGDEHYVSVGFEPLSYGPLSAVVTLGNEICADLPLSGFGRNPVNAGDHIGLFADGGGAQCSADLTPLQMLDLELLAVVPSFADSGITGCEFRLSGLDALAAHAEWTSEWLFPGVQGELDSGVSVEFGEAQPGEIVALGLLHVLPLGEVPANLGLHVERSLDGDQLRVNDHAGLGWDISGGRFTFNCDDPELCDCIDFEAGSCELSDSLLDFGSVSYGSAAYRDFSIGNVGFGPLSGDLQVSGEYFHLSVGEGPFLLGPGEVHQATAVFQPGSTGAFSGVVTTGLADCPEVLLEGIGVGGGGGTPFLGMFSDWAATLCDADTPIYTFVNVYVSVVLPAWLPAITAAEFRIDNYDGLSPYMIVTENWNTPLVIGDPGWGIALAFEPPIFGPVAHLGTLECFVIVDIGSDYMMSIEASMNSGNLIVVGTDYVEYWCQGGLFTFNCGGWFCDCSWATPVTLSLFDIEDLGGSARVRWEAELTGDTEFRLLGSRNGFEWSVPYSELGPGSYEAVDASSALAEAGAVSYRLLAREFGGDWQLLREENLQVEGISYPTRLLAAHPNPFNPQITVPFSLSAAGAVRVSIFDVSGRHVATLAEGHLARGEHRVIWRGLDGDGQAVGSGVYFVKMTAPGYSETQKLVLLR